VLILKRSTPSSWPKVSIEESLPCVFCSAEVQAALGGARSGLIPTVEPVLDRKSVVDLDRRSGDLFQSMSGAGEHELLLETAEHDRPMAVFTVDEVHAILILYRERIRFLRQDNRFRHVSIVKREGLFAGARQNHAHSEVFALPFVPAHVKQSLVQISGHHRRAGSCLYCDMVRTERTEKIRRVHESIQHIAIAPYASRSPFEVLVMPKGHHANFAEAGDTDLADLAALLSEVLRAIDSALDRPALTLEIMSSPLEMGADQNMFHWHVVVRPKLLAFEALDASVETNPVAPEEAARILRKGSAP
jgi:UDPglucose--hexose-1-phosphate uridylyltransferase